MQSPQKSSRPLQRHFEGCTLSEHDLETMYICMYALYIQDWNKYPLCHKPSTSAKSACQRSNNIGNKNTQATTRTAAAAATTTATSSSKRQFLSACQRCCCCCGSSWYCYCWRCCWCCLLRFLQVFVQALTGGSHRPHSQKKNTFSTHRRGKPIEQCSNGRETNPVNSRPSLDKKQNRTGERTEQ